MSKSNSLRTFDLIVIGGGVSGLSSVLNLFKNGYKGKVALLEARNRLGGRILTAKTKFDEEKIEFGANWIHGIIDNPVYNILYQKGIIDPTRLDSKDHGSKVHNVQARLIDGKDVNSYWVNKVCNAYGKMMKYANQMFTSADSNTENIVMECEDSLGLFLEKEIDKWIREEVKNTELEESVRGLFDALLKREACISGCDSVNDVSLKYIGAYEEYLGVHLVIEKGYYSLIECLLEDIQKLSSNARFELFTECPVTQIVWPGTQCSPDKDEKGFRVQITTDSKRTFECNQIIVTCPLGYLKKHSKTLFKPALPEYKLECINKLGFNVVDKIFMEYSSKQLIPSIFKLNDSTTHEMMLLWNTDYRNPDTRWFAKIYSIYYVSDHCIQLWISGHEASEMESMDDNDINRQITEQLGKLFNQPDFPLADNMIITRWSQDQWTYGAYTFIPVGSSLADIKRLNMPIYSRPNDPFPVIAFAGEATHEQYFSTVHGALLSGEIVAKHFIDS